MTKKGVLTPRRRKLAQADPFNAAPVESAASKARSQVTPVEPPPPAWLKWAMPSAMQLAQAHPRVKSTTARIEAATATDDGLRNWARYANTRKIYQAAGDRLMQFGLNVPVDAGRVETAPKPVRKMRATADLKLISRGARSPYDTAGFR